MFKSGFVTIIGKPNVGKSTLLNRIINEKVAIVSPKPQTTRNKIIGILNDENSQIVFIDTPGIHKSKNKLDEYMQDSVDSAVKDVDILLILIDGSKPIRDKDIELIKSYDSKNTILVVNKIDISEFDKLLPSLQVFNDLKNVKDIVPISAKSGKNVDKLVEIIKSHLKEGEKYFLNDEFTDKTERFLVSEAIREKVLILLQDEIPHGVAVDIIEYKETPTLYTISADLICERESHKKIIIGKGGEMLKKIGINARKEIEEIVGTKVMLNLYVKVRDNWRNSKNYVNEYGYNKKDL
jgi:GTP-binding protein Era